MTRLDDRLRPRAAALIGKYGKRVYLQALLTNEYDPAQGKAVTHVLNYDVVGVVRQPSRDLYDRNLAQQGDTVLVLPAYSLPADVVPKTGDTVDFKDGKPVWTVTGVNTDYSGALPVLYSLVLHR